MANPTKLYGYIPDRAVNIVGCVLFGVILLIQLALGLMVRDWWMFVTWGIAAGLELTGYIARVLAHTYPDSFPLYEMQLITLILGPVFMAAGLYYQLAKEVTVYGRQYSHFKPMYYNAVFTTCDVIALIIQAAGGGTAASNLDTPAGPHSGGWIMVGGISFQVFILAIFILMFAHVNWRIFRDSPTNWDPEYASNRARPLFKYWIPAVSISLLFLLIRSIYRIIELSEGWKGHLMRTERYFVIIDGLMIAIGMFALCLVYPGIAYGYVPIEGLNYWRKKKNDQSKESVDFGDGDIDKFTTQEEA